MADTTRADDYATHSNTQKPEISIMSGWIALHRSLADNWLWEEKPFSKAQAWIDILLHANHKPAKIMIKGRLIAVDRGEQARSEVTFSKDWGWSRNKVRRFLKHLQDDGMLEQQTSNVTTIISVCNYSTYQDKQTADDTPNDTAERQQKDSRRYTNNNVNNENNENNINKNIPAKPEYSADDYKLAGWMFNKILNDQPSFKKPNLDKWAKTIRLMRENDNRNHHDMGVIWKWVRNDEFWGPNILSADKFRKQYDALVAKSQNPVNTRSAADDWDEKIRLRNLTMGMATEKIIEGEVISNG